jgi:hypothetical protein
MQQFNEIRKILSQDILASEVKYSIFCGALRNYKRDFLIRPFPSDFFLKDETKDFEKLVSKVH